MKKKIGKVLAFRENSKGEGPEAGKILAHLRKQKQVREAGRWQTNARQNGKVMKQAGALQELEKEHHAKMIRKTKTKGFRSRVRGGANHCATGKKKEASFSGARNPHT